MYFDVSLCMAGRRSNAADLVRGLYLFDGIETNEPV
jgi:hypothetical protein